MTRTAKVLAFPTALDFSPGVLKTGLGELLATVTPFLGDLTDIKEAIRAQYFANHAPKYEGADRTKQQTILAYNVALGLKNYGLLDEGYRLTPKGAELADAAAVDQPMVGAVQILLRRDKYRAF